MRARRIKSFCGGAKTMLFKGKKVGRRAHSARPTRCGFSREPRPLRLRRTAHVRSDAAPAASPRATTPRTHVPHPAHSAPAILLSVGRACPRPPQAGYARNVQSSTKNKSLRQNSRPARTIPIKSRPAACTSGGINNFPVTLKGRPARSAGLPFIVVFSRRTVSPRPSPSVSAGGRWAGTWCGWRRRPGARRRCVPPGCRPWWSTACP